MSIRLEYTSAISVHPLVPPMAKFRTFQIDRASPCGILARSPHERLAKHARTIKKSLSLVYGECFH